MPVVYFKTDTSGLVGLECTPNGRIDFSGLGQKFKLDPSSIELNGILCPKEGLKSEKNWEQIKVELIEDGSSVGTKDDPIMVTGEAPVSTEGEPLKKLKQLPKSPLPIQEFVCMAEQNFLKYKPKELLAVLGNPQEKFLAVSGDLLGNLPGEV